ncbi:hypothetical protein GCM10007173_37290 [Glutamicibacter ardleyensis]|uniref:Uncharacterized protein n=1 Tax=Glutamicibacter ardleyensis TaxID=225894 RepID=A0ABQ2DYJ6_9MICC|nr:hypothetical protein GCM10007173_37290 [Glutamicibacter ardleyensis]
MHQLGDKPVDPFLVRNVLEEWETAGKDQLIGHEVVGWVIHIAGFYPAHWAIAGVVDEFDRRWQLAQKARQCDGLPGGLQLRCEMSHATKF